MIFVNGSSITFEEIIQLVVYSAVSGMALSLLMWFIGYVIRSFFSIINKAMTL
mgnify:CR=1 FL=1